MQKIEIERFDIQPLKASLAGGDQFLAAGIVRINLAHDENRLALSRDGFARKFFGFAFTVHFRRVDERQAKRKPELQSVALGIARAAFSHFPGALAERGYFRTKGKEHIGDHRCASMDCASSEPLALRNAMQRSAASSVKANCRGAPS
jgi:hypothetical protein